MRSPVARATLVMPAAVAAPASARSHRNQGAALGGANLSGRAQFTFNPGGSERSYLTATSASRYTWRHAVWALPRHLRAHRPHHLSHRHEDAHAA